VDEKISKLENLAKQIESEKDFDKSVAKFTEAAGMVKLALEGASQAKGKVFEIIKEIDEFVERELKQEEDS